MSEVTRILDRVQQGEAQAAEELLPLVYEELRKLAAHKMANEAPGQTLQPTALMHEVWLKITGDGSGHFANRRHFFKAAARAMRRILIDRAHRRMAAKRGAGKACRDADELDLPAPTPDDQLLALSEALAKFAIVHGRKPSW